MIIDFHTHVFPDKIAAPTIAALASKGGVTPYSDGTREGLNKRLCAAGVDLAVNMPVMTKPTQFESVIGFAKTINEERMSGGRILSFMGMHPDIEDIEGAVKRIYDEGFLGFKIHPDYQETYFDDEKYVRIISEAKKYGLTVLTHAGPDIGYVGCPVRCTPTRVLRLLDRVGGYSRLILAHLGGGGIYSEVYETLCGEDIYLDTAFSLDFTSRDEILRLIEKHGADRVLFATDSPWADISRYVREIGALGLDEVSEAKIFSENAMRLLATD